MKKIMMLAAFAAMVSLNSCGNKPKKVEVKPVTTEVAKDTTKTDSTTVEVDSVKVEVTDSSKVVK